MQIVVQISSGVFTVDYPSCCYMITYYTIPGLMGPAPPSVRWTCLMLDLEYMMSIYLKHCYQSLKSIKLCANMVVKNMFTSDLLLDPGDTVTYRLLYTLLYLPLLFSSLTEISFSEAKLMGLTSSRGIGPFPREMAFPVPKGTSWHDLYDYIRYNWLIQQLYIFILALMLSLQQ